MATNSYGMLSLGAGDAAMQQQLEARRQQAMDYARLTPQQQSSFNMSQGALTVGQGVGDLARHGVGMMTGADTRNTQEKTAAVRAQIQRELQSVDQNDIDTAYPVIIRILQQHGMVPEAMAAAREYEELKLKNEDRSIKRGELDRKKAQDAEKARQFQQAMASKDPLLLVKAYGDLTLAVEQETDPERKKVLQAQLRALEATMKFKREGNTFKGLVVAAQNGEPAHVVTYNAGTGKIETDETVGGEKTDTSNKATGGKIDEWMGVKDQVQKLVELAGSFRANYSGDLMSKAATVTSLDSFLTTIRSVTGAGPAASNWWASYAAIINQVRHDLFGATLTVGENQAFNQVKALIGQPPSGVLGRVKAMALAGVNNLITRVQGASDAGQSNVAPLLAQVKALLPAVQAMSTTPGFSGAAPAAAPTAVPTATPVAAMGTPRAAASSVGADVIDLLRKHLPGYGQ